MTFIFSFPATDTLHIISILFATYHAPIALHAAGQDEECGNIVMDQLPDADDEADAGVDGKEGPSPPPQIEPIASETALQYIGRFQSICRRASLALNLDPGARIDRVELVEWLIGAFASSIKKSTWRFYRAAVIHVLDAEHTEDAGEALSILANHSPGGGFSKRSSRRIRRKQLPKDDLAEICRELLAAASDYGHLTATWLEVSRALGVRPVEVGTTRAETEEDGTPTVVVANAKTSQGRGLGKERRLSLSVFPEADRQRYLAFFDVMRGVHARGEYETTYASCRKLLHQVNLRLWPWRKSTYSLYSGRHQFSANAKECLDLVGVATLMGHASDVTAVRHYGKRRKGDGSLVPKVDESARDKVRLSYRPGARPAAVPAADGVIGTAAPGPRLADET